MKKEWQQHPRRWALTHPERPAVIYPSLGVTLTYGELDSLANKTAHFLRAQGIQRGDHFALLVENVPVFHQLAWAGHNAGAYYTAISWRFGDDEIAFIIENCDASLVFFTDKQAELVDRLRPRLKDVTFVNVSDGSFASDYPDSPIPDESRGSDMLYSSGSTGRPKGIKQALPDAGVDGLSKMFSIYKERYDWGDDTVYLMPCPLYHSGPLRFAMAMQHVGATMLVMDKFNAEEALSIVERYGVTNAQWVPTMIVRLLKLPQAVKDKYDLSTLEVIIHGAAPIAPDVKHEALKWFGPILEESYGGTEGNGLTMITSQEWLEHPGSVGRPFLGAIHVLDDNGKELPTGEIGTIWFSGGPDFIYHKDPDRTREAHDSGGRSTLGDIGYVDEEGYVYLTDRRSNMVISGGVNVYPQEAENRLMSHSGVADASVFGVPHEDMGEVLHAVVQPLDQEADQEALQQELMVWCREGLASIKCPRSWEFRKSLPRHDTGKIYARHLKNEWLARHRTS
ncbi:MAG: acyl-CoA synthetase [Hirschia sp.]|nr:acyl-CoA synthetase [Hirschia sp.]MBF18325.1 acyl-CoA synthetase [Hirschia sp.]|tara:strand:+ start:385 stop:1911 length:1527 start_codon:yes stop_codon:yes gene_type:complete